MNVKRLLVVDGGSDVRPAIEAALRPYGVGIDYIGLSVDVLSHLAANVVPYSLMVVDLKSGEEPWMRRIDSVRRAWPQLPVLFCLPEKVESLNAHQEYPTLKRPFCVDMFLSAVQNAIGTLSESTAVQETAVAANEEVRLTGTWSQRIESTLIRIGASDVPVLLQGETGVGKEVIARRLHALSRRAGRPFVKLNCAALPSELVESELFGYERGAFTGAVKSTAGKFEMAHRGTILLDEIGDMDFRLQAKLLQVLQDHEFYRLGSHEPSRVDVRVMAASHCDFERAIEAKKFREDLYYRLNIVDVKIPPLRERRGEILPLCEVFLERHASVEWPKLEIEPILRQVLVEYHWPGNVRELENVMRKYLVIRSAGVLAAEIRQRTVRSKTVYIPDGVPRRRSTDWIRKPETIETSDTTSSRPATVHEMTLPPERSGPSLVPRPAGRTSTASVTTLSGVEDARKQAEAEAILQALQTSLWNRKRAAALLNVDYKSLLYRMKKLGIGEKGTAVCG